MGEYFAWLARVESFLTVEKRKRLTKFEKATGLLVLGWVCWFLIASLAGWIVVTSKAVHGYILGALILFLSPILLSYVIVIPLLLLQLTIQRPIEYITIQRAKRKLAKHKGVKIAIAGSFGKTSMREILRTVLSEDKNVSAPPHSYNTLLGISHFIQTLQGDEDVLVFEFGEYYPGDVKKLCNLVHPDIGIITGVNEAHLQKFKTLEKTTKTIFELADELGTKLVYVNGESELAQKNAREGHLIYSRRGVGEWKVMNARSDLSGTSFSLEKDGIATNITSLLLGLHQIGPLAVSVDLARRLGATPSQIRAGTSKTKPFDHRLQLKVDRNGVTTLDDSYNGNPDGVKAVIAFLASLKGRRFYVTPGLVEMGSKKEEVHRDIGKELVRAGIEQVILIKNSVTPFIEEGLRTAKYKGEITWFDDGPSAYAALPHMIVKGDIILLQNDWPDQYA